MTTWLSDLEKKVQAASNQLQELRKQNRSYKSKLQKLRRELAEARAEPSGSWEREQVRQRVSRLANRLEEII